MDSDGEGTALTLETVGGRIPSGQWGQSPALTMGTVGDRVLRGQCKQWGTETCVDNGDIGGQGAMWKVGTVGKEPHGTPRGNARA